MFKYLFSILTVLSLVSYSVSSFACSSGWSLSNEDILNTAEYALVLKSIQSKYPSQSSDLVVESIVNSGNDVLNLDKEVVASAMCAASYLNIYIQGSSGLLCSVSFEPGSHGAISVTGGQIIVVCRTNKEAKSEGIFIPYKK